MNKPVCQTVLPWLRANLGKRCLAPLTSTDARALAAAVQTIELYSYDRDASVLHAFGYLVRRMQPHCQPLAYHAIAHVMEWSDRAWIWRELDLPPFTSAKCAFEPGGAQRPTHPQPATV